VWSAANEHTWFVTHSYVCICRFLSMSSNDTIPAGTTRESHGNSHVNFDEVPIRTSSKMIFDTNSHVRILVQGGEDS